MAGYSNWFEKGSVSTWTEFISYSTGISGGLHWTRHSTSGLRKRMWNILITSICFLLKRDSITNHIKKEPQMELNFGAPARNCSGTQVRQTNKEVFSCPRAWNALCMFCSKKEIFKAIRYGNGGKNISSKKTYLHESICHSLLELL